MEDDSKDDTHQTQEGGTTTKNIDFNKNQMYSLHSIRITIFFLQHFFAVDYTFGWLQRY